MTAWAKEPKAGNGDMNTGQKALTDQTPESQVPETIADPALTLKAKKLAGSTCCLNCGTALQGPFCHYCGQPDRNFMRFFPVLLRDMMEDLLDLDSRFLRTIKPLMFKPGRLTRDYMSGRRFRYAPPMRLYIFSSIVFFLLAALLSNDAISVNGVDTDTGVVQHSEENLADLQAAKEAFNELPPDVRSKIDIDTFMQESASSEPEKKVFSLDGIKLNDEPWNRETNPVSIKWLPDWLNERINAEIEGSPQKAQQINQNPNLLIDKVFDILPATMFILLPLVALIFKFWYLFAKRFYIEHLIFSLHNHSFMFVSLTLILLAEFIETLLIKHGYSTAAGGISGLTAVMSMWIPIYMLISLRVVYAQSWGLTIVKFAVIGMSYAVLLALVTSGVAIASFVLL